MTTLPRELQEAARFHTHLGPYLVVGLRMGRVVTRELGSEPFSYRIRAHTGRVPPYSCSVDGVQLATPCTTGNGCIDVTDDRRMAIDAIADGVVLTVTLRSEVFESIENNCSEEDQEEFALRIWEMPDDELFTVSRGGSQMTRGGSAGRIPTRTLTGTALLLALGVVLPVVFHAFPLGGRIFLPMHLPTFVAGLILGPVAGIVVGAGSPIVSGLLTGRPTVFYMVPMVFELATYGLVAGFLRTRFATLLRRRARASGLAERSGATASPLAAVSLALVCSMLAGRVVWIAAVVWLAPVIGLTARTIAMALGAIGAGWIGMAIQLALIPAIVRAIERTGKT